MAKPKSRIRIQDLSREVKVSADEMKRVTGGAELLQQTGGTTGYCVSNPFLKGELTSFCIQNPQMDGKGGDIQW